MRGKVDYVEMPGEQRNCPPSIGKRGLDGFPGGEHWGMGDGQVGLDALEQAAPAATIALDRETGDRPSVFDVLGARPAAAGEHDASHRRTTDRRYSQIPFFDCGT
jgi:hypothetical protein